MGDLTEPSVAAGPPVVTSEQVRAVARAALVNAGATHDDAAVQAEHLLEAELRGHPSHGIMRLPILTERLRKGLIVSGVHPSITANASGALAVDGELGFGPVVVHKTLDWLLPRAKTNGIAIAVLHRAHHLGMLSPYLDRMTEEGFIGVVLTTSEGLVHPWGGRGALIGTNPLGIGVPNGSSPVILDMSTGTTSAGKVRDYASRGAELEDGWAVDALGHSTRDAEAAMDGAISPFGGAKGYALGITLEALVALATRSAYGQAVTGTLDSVHPTTKGDVIIAISLSALGANPADPELNAYLQQVRESGVDGNSVSVPGDRARRQRDSNLVDGCEIDVVTWATALRLAGGKTE